MTTRTELGYFSFFFETDPVKPAQILWHQICVMSCLIREDLEKTNDKRVMADVKGLETKNS